MTYAIIIAVLLACSAFFSASETAFSSVNRIRLKNYANQGDKRAEIALKIVTDFDKALTAILIGNNIVNIASASLATIAFTEILGPSSVGFATLVMTVLVLIFGEILPKSLAKENAEKFTLAIARIMTFLIFILKPLIFLFTLIKKGVINLIGNKNGDNPSVTEEELKFIIEEIEDEGVLEEQEGELVRSALEFDEISLEEILIPRVNIVGVKIDDDIENIKNIFMTERYSRMPVFEKTMDNIVGIIHQKDFFNMYLSGGKKISSIVKKPLYFSEYKKISEVMATMQRSKNHMAIVLDQYGGTEGLVTLEDIIEELVGEIYDENDEVVQEFEKIAENRYKISGALAIGNFLENLELDEKTIDTECNSVGGWVMELLEHIPSEGECVSFDNMEIKVTDIDDQQIKSIEITTEKNNETLETVE